MTRAVIIDYNNWRSERRKRTIIPVRIEFTNSEWHPLPQWILYAIDEEKKQEREFAIRDIHSWEPIED